MQPGIYGSMDSPLAGVELRSGLLATEDSDRAKRDRFLGERDSYEMKNKQSKKQVLETNTAVKVCSTRRFGTKETCSYCGNRK